MRAWLAVAMALACAQAFAEAPVPDGPARTDGRLRDPDFHVDSHAIGLERRVEMYQWRRDGAQYTRVWNAAPIDSSGFDAAHRNPVRLPVAGRQWWAQRVTVAGIELPLPTARELGQWVPLRPTFSGLPGTLARRYQPEGDGLGSAYNPLQPQVGDVRITWHEFVLPPLVGKVEARGGVWVLTPRTAAAPQGARPAVDIVATAHALVKRFRPGIIAIALLALVAVWFLVRPNAGGRR